MFKALHNVNSTCYTYRSYQTYPCLYVRTYIHTSFSCISTLHSQDASLYDCNMCSSMTGSISVVHTGILQLWASTRHIPQHRKSQLHTMTTSGWSSAQTACSRMQTVGVVHSSIRHDICMYSVGGGGGGGGGMCPHLNTLGNGLQLLGSELLKGAALHL